MITAITDGIKVSVKVGYRHEYSNPFNAHYVFTYKICIENCSDAIVQLLRRHWFVYDSDGSVMEVEGEGVVGKQPIIYPQMQHEYVSGCHLKTDMGKMKGTYLLKREGDDRLLEVAIPEFTLIAPARLN
ncbi:MAG: Co2+/Mg2+ efflux protein ApaG [Bernardetiaceae bacterium]|nr:Co2+/Mg2+ efflux protein ApaG [Bernardetiaceae bacterium]